MVKLLKKRDVQGLSAELELMEGFLPHDWPSPWLKKARAEIQKLPREKQDAVAKWLIAEIADEREWDRQFEDSQDLLERLADEALADRRAGRTKPLDPNAL